MATNAVQIEGLDNLRAGLRKTGQSIDDLKDANAQAASTVAQWAGVTSPRRSGALGASVRGTRQAKRAEIRAGNAGVPYAGPIHWGWPARNIAAQPFVSEAAVSTEPAWLPRYRDAIQRLLDKVRGV